MTGKENVFDDIVNNRLSTKALNEKLKNAENFAEFEDNNKEEFLKVSNEVGDYLQKLLYQYDKKATVVSEEAGLNRSYVGNIINKKKNNPSRDALICICIAMGTTLEEVQDLLKYAGYAQLYPRKRRDAVIQFGIINHKSLYDINDMIIKKGGEPLFKDL